MKFDLLIFDIDDTLLDYRQSESEAFTRTLREVTPDLNPDTFLDIYRQVNRKYWLAFEAGECTIEPMFRERFREAFAMAGAEVLRADKFGEFYLNTLAQKAYPVPGAMEVLRQLKDDYKLAGLSNGIRFIQESRCRISGLDNFLETVVTSEDTGFAKPDPRIFQAVIENMKSKDSDLSAKLKVLYIGDRYETDVLGPAAVGWSTCWFNPRNKSVPGEINPDIIIANWQDFIPELYKLEASTRLSVPDN